MGRASGGTCAALRQNSSLERIRDYHRRIYRPQNLRIIITGNVAAADVLNSLEGSAVPEDPEPFNRPWQHPAPPLLQSTGSTVYFAGHNMEPGLLLLGWRLPEDPPMMAIVNLFTFLTKSPLSPIPLALNKPVAFSFDGESSVYLIITHLVEAEMDDVVGKVIEVLGQERNWQEVMVLEEQREKKK